MLLNTSDLMCILDPSKYICNRGMAKQRKEGSFRERKVFSTKGRYQWGPGRYFTYLVILLRQFSGYGVLFSKKVGTRGLKSGIKGSVSFKEQTVIKQVPFAKGMFYTKGRSL